MIYDGLEYVFTIWNYRTAHGALFGKSTCWTYEVWDTRNRLAYVGLADSFPKRWAQHERTSWWLGEIEVERVVLIGWMDREDARQHEAAVINEQNPVYNTATEAPAYRRYLDRDLPALEVERFELVTRPTLDIAGERRLHELARGL